MDIAGALSLARFLDHAFTLVAAAGIIAALIVVLVFLLNRWSHP
jgi:hypothetical protein